MLEAQSPLLIARLFKGVDRKTPNRSEESGGIFSTVLGVELMVRVPPNGRAFSGEPSEQRERPERT
jgi:hypothetical protein